MPDSFSPRRILDLGSSPGIAWQFGHVPQQVPWRRRETAWSPSPDGIDDLDAVAEWLPAAVPGNVRSDLLALERIPDPFSGDGLAASRWTEGVDWWYRTRLPLAAQPGQRAFLELDGVDYLSAIFVAGRELGRHEGMFSRQVYEIPPDLLARDEVELAVRIWGSDALPGYPIKAWERTWGRIAELAQGAFLPFDDRLATLKTPMHFGWDFAPRLRAMGIWDAARLVICQGVYAADLHVQAEPQAGGAPTDPGPARLALALDLDSDAPRDVVAHVAIRPANPAAGDGIFRFSRPLVDGVPAGRSRHELALELASARLWQPWERGEPYRYHLTVELRDGDTLLDSISTVFGIRRIERQLTAGGQPWRFLVNGRPLYLRGANWVPVDSLPGRAGPERYQGLLRRARDAGLNFLRVWGGGGREKRAFYEQCDQLGLLVWQEFPIACVFLDHLPRSEAYLQLLRQEVAGIVRLLRNHPSLFLWCGGNEFSPTRNRPAGQIMAEAVASGDGSRPWVATSPGPGDKHNWLVWHGQAPLGRYRQEDAAFASEFGLQALPDPASLRRFLDPEDLWPPGPGWERHKGDLAKLNRYAAWFLEDGSPSAPAEAALAAYVRASQQAQAAGLQVMIEHLRRRKGLNGGLAVWQWNEPWPAICWSVIDYFGRPKLACETLSRVMQPQLVSLAYPLRRYRAGDRLAGALWLVNDGEEALPGCRLLASLDGKQVHAQSCDLPAAAAAIAGELAITLPAGFRQLRLELRLGNRLLAENVYDLRFHDDGPDSSLLKLRRRVVDLIMR